MDWLHKEIICFINLWSNAGIMYDPITTLFVTLDSNEVIILIALLGVYVVIYRDSVTSNKLLVFGECLMVEKYECQNCKRLSDPNTTVNIEVFFLIKSVYT